MTIYDSFSGDENASNKLIMDK